MTETQRKWLTEYLGECWHKWDVILNPQNSSDYISQCKYCGIKSRRNIPNRTFTTAQDKQDLLEKVIRKGEWDAFIVYIDWFSVVNPAYRFTKAQIVSFISWLIQLSPEKTAELICKWKGVLEDK